jgi:hypothetical protein
MVYDWLIPWHGATLGTPPLVSLIALYVTGVIVLDRRPTQTRVATFLPARCHDALNRLVRVMPLSTRQIMQVLIAFVGRLNRPGYLCLDDVIVEKAFAKKLPWAGWTYSHSKGRKLYGLHIVMVLWCSTDHRWRIPVAFRIWRPKRSCSKHRYQTKNQLAAQMMKEILATGLRFAYLVFDTAYTAGWLTKYFHRLKITWQGTLMPNTKIKRRESS